MSSFERELIEVLRDHNRLLEQELSVMASLDADVQAATALIGELVTALQNAASPVSAADQTALETAITAGQAALPATPAPEAAPTEPAPVPEAPVASPEVS